MSAELTAAQQSGQTAEKQLTEARATMEKYLRDYDTLFNRTQKLTEDLEDQVGIRRIHAGILELQTAKETKANASPEKLEDGIVNTALPHGLVVCRLPRLFITLSQVYKNSQLSVEAANADKEMKKKVQCETTRVASSPDTRPFFGDQRSSKESLVQEYCTLWSCWTCSSFTCVTSLLRQKLETEPRQLDHHTTRRKCRV